MKCAFAVLCVFFVLDKTCSADMPFMQQMNECGSEMGFTPDEIMGLATKHDAQTDCLRACVLEKLGGIKNGKLDQNGLLTYIDQNKDNLPNYEQIRANVPACYEEATTLNTDKCLVGGKFSLCMHEHMTGTADIAMNGASQLNNLAHNINKFGR